MPAGEFDAAINAALNDYEIMRLKAKAFDRINQEARQRWKEGPRLLFEILDGTLVSCATVVPQPKE